MEMTFYDDSAFRGPKNDGKALKRPVTLDFESPDSMSKKQKFAAILTSPDLHMLKLASPELERFIISNGNITTTPTPTQFLFSKDATEEQENYARGFIDALNQLHQSQFGISPSAMITFSTGNTPVSTNTSLATSIQASLANSVSQKPYAGSPPAYSQSATTTSVIKSLGNAKAAPKSLVQVRPPSADSNSCNSMSNSSVPLSLEIAIKEELQTVPSDFSSPPLSPISKGPIDLETQERIKLERKRYRNRLAASKCRKRKLEKISQLEDKVKELKNENSQLENMVDRLREQVCSLKQEVLNHVKKGCQIMISHT